MKMLSERDMLSVKAMITVIKETENSEADCFAVILTRTSIKTEIEIKINRAKIGNISVKFTGTKTAF